MAETIPSRPFRPGVEEELKNLSPRPPLQGGSLATLSSLVGEANLRNVEPKGSNVELRSNHRLSACCRLAGASIKTKEVIRRNAGNCELGVRS